MLIRIAIVVVVALAALAGFVASRPTDFAVARSRTVAAPPEVVHGYVNDLRKWVEWSPWEKRDPALKREYSGPPAGPGAAYHWVGNSEVGEGRMTDRREHAGPHDRPAARVSQAVRGDARGALRLRAERRGHERDVDDARREELHGQGVRPLDRYG